MDFDVMDSAHQAMSWLGDLVSGFVVQVAGFFLQFFPNADPGIMASIGSWWQSMSGYDLTFNYFYFVDLNLVAGFFDAAVIMLLSYMVVVFVKLTYNLVTSLVEMIPVIE